MVAPTDTPLPAAPSPTPAPTSTPSPLQPLALTPLWRFSANQVVWDVGVADLDGDGKEEVAAASQDKMVYLLDGEGRPLWSYAARAAVYTLSLADLEGDGRGEVIAGSDDNHVYVLTHEGRLRWSYETGSRVTKVAAYDLDQDGQKEVLASSWDGYLYLLTPAGELRWRALLGSGATDIEVFDLQKGGSPEIITASEEGEIKAWTAQGQPLWSYKAGGYPRQVALTPSGEVAAGSSDGSLYLLAPDGALRWRHRIGSSIPSLQVADLGGASQIVLGSGYDDGRVYLIDGEGRGRWASEMGGGVWALEVLDLDEDGEEEIVAAGDGGWACIFDLYGRRRDCLQVGGRIHGLLALDDHKVILRSGNEVVALEVSPSGEEGDAYPKPVSLPAGSLPPAEVPDDLIELVAVGDILLCRTMEERMNQYGLDYPFAATAELLRSADIAIGNLECPLSTQGEPIDKPFLFRAHPRNLAALTEAGFDVISLANNHLLDFGPQAMRETLEGLEGNGLRYVGAGPEAHAPLMVEVKGRTIAFLAYAAIRWKGSPEVPTEEEIAFAEVDRIREEVKEAKKKADLVVVIMHLGKEYQEYPDEEQLAVSRAAVEAGAALVIGHHPHVVQEAAPYGGGFIAYSLGDFVFDMPWEEEGAILRAFLGPGGVERVELIPVQIAEGVQPRFLVDEEGKPVVHLVYERPPFHQEVVLGHSSEGRPLVAHRFGWGEKKVVLVGNVHGGTEENTYRLMRAVVEHYEDNPGQVAPQVTLWVIPTINPDGLANGSRLNARGVDLNRNADTDQDPCPDNDWSQDTMDSDGLVPGGGGEAPFSEVESRLLRDFLADAQVAIFYHSQGGMVLAGGCGQGPSQELAHLLAQATGYRESSWSAYPVTGNMVDYLTQQGVAAVEVELSNKVDIELERNLRGIQEAMESIEEVIGQ